MIVVLLRHAFAKVSKEEAFQRFVTENLLSLGGMKQII